MNNRTPNWKKWQLIPDAKLWEIVALSLDIEPSMIKFSPHSWMGGDLYFEEDTEFRDRLDILKANLGKSPLLNPTSISMGAPSSCKLCISNVGAWAESVKWNLPSDFPREGLDVSLKDKRSITSHETNPNKSEKLSYLNQASQKFWARADRNDRTTHPNNNEVAQWLIEQGGYSQTLAESAATIIRPEWAVTGRKPD